jgi:hypothetical protein
MSGVATRDKFFDSLVARPKRAASSKEGREDCRMSTSEGFFGAVDAKVWRCGGLGRVVHNDVAGASVPAAFLFLPGSPLKNVGLSCSRRENECSPFVSRVSNNKRYGSRSEGRVRSWTVWPPKNLAPLSAVC